MLSPPSSRRASSYPAVSLGSCLKKSQCALESLPSLSGVPRAWVTRKDLAQAFGYKGFEDNSAPKGLLSAMTHFGLLECDAQKRVRFVAELIAALSDEDEKASFISKVVVRPKIHQALFAEFGSQIKLSRQQVAKHLTETCGFSARPAQMMAFNFIEDAALLRSISSTPAAARYVESITTPQGARVRVASDQELTSSDLAYIEKVLRLKREGMSAQYELGV